jgi:putative tricarboxylic transport membrane protein
MRRWDQIASFVGMGIGVLLVFSSLRLNLGQWTQPGPGFLPLCSGVLLIILCVVYGVWSFGRKDESSQKKESPWPRENLGKIIGVLIALFLFAFLLPLFGYLLSTFLLMIFLFRVIEPERWPLTFLKAALSVGVTYAIFEKWLMVQFPKGFWGV